MVYLLGFLDASSMQQIDLNAAKDAFSTMEYQRTSYARVLFVYLRDAPPCDIPNALVALSHRSCT